MPLGHTLIIHFRKVLWRIEKTLKTVNHFTRSDSQKTKKKKLITFSFKKKKKNPKIAY